MEPLKTKQIIIEDFIKQVFRENLIIQVLIKDRIKQNWYFLIEDLWKQVFYRGLYVPGNYIGPLKTNYCKGLYVTYNFKGCCKSDHYVTVN